MGKTDRGRKYDAFLVWSLNGNSSGEAQVRRTEFNAGESWGRGGQFGQEGGHFRRKNLKERAKETSRLPSAEAQHRRGKKDRWGLWGLAI